MARRIRPGAEEPATRHARSRRAVPRAGLEVHTPPPRARGTAVVCVAVQSPPSTLALCLASVLAHTPAQTPIVVAELASRDPEVAELIGELAGTRPIELLAPLVEAPVANLAAALRELAAADVVLLSSECTVADGWSEDLRAAAYSASHVASASALSNDAGVLSVPERAVAGRAPAPLSDATSAAVRDRAARSHPLVPVAADRAVYLRRDALELVGGLDATLGTVHAAIVDFSQRAVCAGLVNVAADEVLVRVRSSGPEDSARADQEAVADPVLRSRYPFLEDWLEDVERTQDEPLPAALRRARRAVAGLSLTVDARCLVRETSGTQVVVLETIRALAGLDTLELRAIVPHDLGEYARETLRDLDVVLIGADAVEDHVASDVIHRPFQVSSSSDLRLLQRLGERIVVTHLDLIAYDNPSYFPTYGHWRQYRFVTRTALALADRVAFLSRHAAAEALTEQLVDEARAAVISHGVDSSYRARSERERPAGLERLADRPFLVSLGSDLQHKNRVFALELLAALRREHDWPGGLVLAGPRLSFGSSAGEELRFLAANPELADSVVTLPWISEPEKAWLIESSAAVCHPSTREGLGLVPFEAAELGRPCIFAATTAMAELQPEGLATIVPWDANASAARILALLGDAQAVASHVERTRERARELTWSRTAQELLATYDAAMAAPSRDARRIAHDLARSELDRAEVHRKYDELWEGLSRDGQLLVRPGGLLDAEDQRALLAVARRPWLRRVVLGQARLLRRLTRNPAPLPLPPITRAEDFDLHFAESNREYMSKHLPPMPELEE